MDLQDIKNHPLPIQELQESEQEFLGYHYVGGRYSLCEIRNGKVYNSEYRRTEIKITHWCYLPKPQSPED